LSLVFPLDEAHRGRGLRERLVVGQELVPVHELAVGAHPMAEELLRRRQVRRPGSRLLRPGSDPAPRADDGKNKQGSRGARQTVSAH